MQMRLSIDKQSQNETIQFIQQLGNDLFGIEMEEIDQQVDERLSMTMNKFIRSKPKQQNQIYNNGENFRKKLFTNDDAKRQQNQDYIKQDSNWGKSIIKNYQLNLNDSRGLGQQKISVSQRICRNVYGKFRNQREKMQAMYKIEKKENNKNEERWRDFLIREGKWQSERQKKKSQAKLMRDEQLLRRQKIDESRLRLWGKSSAIKRVWQASSLKNNKNILRKSFG